MGVTVYNKGQSPFTATEANVVWLSRTWTSSPRPIPVIYGHHATGTALTPFASTADPTDAAVGRIIRGLTSLNLAVISGDQAGTSSFSNPAALATVDAAISYLNTTLGTRTDKVAFVTDSMGTLLAWNWALRNPTRVAAIAALLPVPNLYWLYRNGPGAIPTNIEIAFGGAAAYLAVEPEYDPAQRFDELVHIPTRLWVSEDDPVAIPANAIDFAEKVGATYTSLGAVGHTLVGFDENEVIDWLSPYVLVDT